MAPGLSGCLRLIGCYLFARGPAQEYYLCLSVVSLGYMRFPECARFTKPRPRAGRRLWKGFRRPARVLPPHGERFTRHERAHQRGSYDEARRDVGVPGQNRQLHEVDAKCRVLLTQATGSTTRSHPTARGRATVRLRALASAARRPDLTGPPQNTPICFFSPISWLT